MIVSHGVVVVVTAMASVVVASIHRDRCGLAVLVVHLLLGQHALVHETLFVGLRWDLRRALFGFRSFDVDFSAIDSRYFDSVDQVLSNFFFLERNKAKASRDASKDIF